MIFPNAATLRVFHDAQLKRFGGAPGMRDPGLLEAAVGRLRSALAYSEMDAVDAAALLCHAVLKNHAFVDGNKRVALTASAVFLEINGRTLTASEAETVVIFEGLAASKHGEDELTLWLEKNTTSRSK